MHLSQARAAADFESSLLTGELEPTNEAYAIAKISGIIAIKGYSGTNTGGDRYQRCPQTCTGPGSESTRSHVLPAMIRKYHDAAMNGDAVQLWGTGSPRREFLHVDDLASAVVFLLEHYDSDKTINVGAGTDVTIRELARIVAETTGFTDETRWDETKPDGTPAQAARREPPPRARMASADRTRGGHRGHLFVVPRPRGGAGRPAVLTSE